jgi:hypothetical protein
MDIAGNGFTASPHYRVMIDDIPIEFYSFEPDGEEVFTQPDVECTIWVRDNPGGSGVDLASIEYRCRTDGVYTEWMPAGIPGVVNDTWFEIIVELKDGDDNRVQVRGGDLAGNGPTMSAEYRIVVDTTPPSINIVSPPMDEIQPRAAIRVTIEISEELSGLGPMGVEYRIRLDGMSDFSDWTPVDVGTYENGTTVNLDINMALGRNNTIQFRSTDGAGNGMVTDPYHIWVNTPPVAIISSPPRGFIYAEGEEIFLNGSGSHDPDDGPVTFGWYSDHSDGFFLGVSEGHMVLPPGTWNITLVVKDGQEGEDRAQVIVVVVRPSPPSTSQDEGEFPWFLFLILLLVCASAVMVYRSRMRMDEGSSEDPPER